MAVKYIYDKNHNQLTLIYNKALCKIFQEKLKPTRKLP